jgi:hypothetical protein
MASSPLELLLRGEFFCPACGARQAWSDACRRCRCDLALFHRAVSARLAQRERCLRHLASGDVTAALDAAEQAYAFSPSPDAAELVAVCRLLNHDYRGALAAHRLASIPHAECGA